MARDWPAISARTAHSKRADIYMDVERSAHEPPATLIFLDIDGVLNTYTMTSEHEDAYHPPGFKNRMREWNLVLSRSRLEAFAELVTTHHAAIVLSTAWRVEVDACHALRRSLADFSISDQAFVGKGLTEERAAEAHRLLTVQQAEMESVERPCCCFTCLAAQDEDAFRHVWRDACQELEDEEECTMVQERKR